MLVSRSFSQGEWQCQWLEVCVCVCMCVCVCVCVCVRAWVGWWVVSKQKLCVVRSEDML